MRRGPPPWETNECFDLRKGGTEGGGNPQVAPQSCGRQEGEGVSGAKGNRTRCPRPPTEKEGRLDSVNLCLQSRQLRESPWKGLALPSGGMGLVKIPHMSFLHPPTPSSRGGRGEHTNIHPSPPREERIGVEERTKTKERRNGRTY